MRIAVAGGTGVVGRHAVAQARAAGHEVVVLSRAGGVDVGRVDVGRVDVGRVDVITGAGLVEALQGADAVIDATNTTTLSATKAIAFFETASRTLLAAEEVAGVGHHVTLSIVGIDGIDSSYYAGKLAQERAVAAGSVPFTIARAAQFHEFAGQLLAGMSGPVALMPKLLMRPVAAREVGEHLVRVASGAAAGRARDLVGPRDEVLVDLARRQLAFDGVRRRVWGVRLPGAYGKGLASGSLRSARRAASSSATRFSAASRRGARDPLAGAWVVVMTAIVLSCTAVCNIDVDGCGELSARAASFLPRQGMGTELWLNDDR
jgi:uncharacterized protein YbjT (DUF2867 family)